MCLYLLQLRNCIKYLKPTFRGEKMAKELNIEQEHTQFTRKDTVEKSLISLYFIQILVELAVN